MDADARIPSLDPGYGRPRRQPDRPDRRDQPRTRPRRPRSADEVLVRYRADATARPATRRRRATSAWTSCRPARTGEPRSSSATACRPPPSGAASTPTRASSRWPPTIAASSPPIPRPSPASASEWGLHNTGQPRWHRATTGIADIDIDGLEALRITHGDPSIVVAVIDDGVDFSHPDLAARAWTNPGETGAATTGSTTTATASSTTSTAGTSATTTARPRRRAGRHGTHVAGTIAASLNGVGRRRRGARRSRSWPSSSSTTAGLRHRRHGHRGDRLRRRRSASRSSTRRGAAPDAEPAARSGDRRVRARCSWPPPGTRGWNIDMAGTTTSTRPSSPLPTSSASRRSISAAAWRAFSNYGATTVDVAAPGTNICHVPGRTGFAVLGWSAGTSMAAPARQRASRPSSPSVAGAPRPGRRSKRGARRVAPLRAAVGKTVTGRLVNALRASTLTGPTARALDRHGITPGTIVGSTVSTIVSWPAATDDLTGVASYVVRADASAPGRGPRSPTTSRAAHCGADHVRQPTQFRGRRP